MKHDLRWFEEYAENADILKPLTPKEWKELAALLHEVNSINGASEESVGHSYAQEVTHVTVEVVNCNKIDSTIESLQKVIDSKPLTIVGETHLIDIMSILQGIKNNYQHGYSCTKHVVPFNKNHEY